MPIADFRMPNVGGSDAMRTSVTLDAETVKSNAQLGCTTGQIAAILGCKRGTIERRFGKLIARTRAEQVAALSKMQWDKAKEGNVPMLIWLGKQWLNQSERITEKLGDAPEAVRVELDFGEEPRD